MKVNPKALEKARQLIDEGKFRISTPWRDVQPSVTAEDRFIDRYGWEAFAQWHLAIDPDAPDHTKDRYKFPFGDFNAIHRSGLVAAKQRAAQHHYDEVETAADELLELFDRINAC